MLFIFIKGKTACLHLPPVSICVEWCQFTLVFMKPKKQVSNQHQKKASASQRTLICCHSESIFHKSLLVSGFLEHQYTDGFLSETFWKTSPVVSGCKTLSEPLLLRVQPCCYSHLNRRTTCMRLVHIRHHLLSESRWPEERPSHFSLSTVDDRKWDSCCHSSHPGRQEPPLSLFLITGYHMVRK